MATRSCIFFAFLLAGTPSALAADWPPAVDPIGIHVEAKVALDRTTFVPNPENPSERLYQRAHSEAEVHAGPNGTWSLTRFTDRPWDEVQVLRRGRPNTNFQVNPKPDMLLQTTGTLLPSGGSAYLPAEPFGWCDTSLGNPTAERTYRDTLARFRVTAVERQGDRQTFRGVGPAGLTATVVTDLTGRRLREMTFEHLAPGFRLTRHTEYRAWEKVGGHFVPTKGMLSFQVDQAGVGGRESDVTSFTLTNLKTTAKPMPPPFEEGMLFREIGAGMPKAFLYRKGVYVPTKDPGAVYVKSPPKREPPSPAGLYLLIGTVIGSGFIFLRRSRLATGPSRVRNLRR
ncbi:MAG: hypothetical protein ACO1SV_06950 [Fimbriimonas sp.]